MNLQIPLVSLLAATLLAAPASAATLTFSTWATGSYNDIRPRSLGNRNSFGVTYARWGGEDRNFYTFDLSSFDASQYTLLGVSLQGTAGGDFHSETTTAASS